VSVSSLINAMNTVFLTEL